MAAKKNWLKILAHAFDHQDEKMIQSLRRLAAFETLSETDINALAKRCHIRYFSAQEEVYAEKSPSAAVYFIVNGSIGLYKKRKSQATDRVQAVSAGHFFGESALIEKAVRTHSAKALEKTQVIVLFQSDFAELETVHPHLALSILKLVAAKISRELHIFQTEFHELSQKLARDQLMD